MYNCTVIVGRHRLHTPYLLHIRIFPPVDVLILDLGLIIFLHSHSPRARIHWRFLYLNVVNSVYSNHVGKNKNSIKMCCVVVIHGDTSGVI